MPSSSRILFTTVFMAALVTSSVFAGTPQARPSTKSFTCQGVRNFIKDWGAVVMNAKSANVYRRFVANRSFCSPGQVTIGYSVPTKTGRCRLRICVDADIDDWFENRRLRRD